MFIFLTQHSVILFLESANTVDTGISCAYLRLPLCYFKTFWAKKNACVHLVSYKLGSDTKLIHYSILETSNFSLFVDISK